MDRYDIQHKIGEGSFGVVYLATKKNSGEKRAIKILRNIGSKTTATATKRFTWDEMNEMRELQSMLQLQPQDHPNIVRLYEVHRYGNGSISFVFEYMSHGTLLELMDQYRDGGKTLPNHEVRNLVHQILLGVHHMHSRNVYHRDLKPENILLGPNHICKVADFSLARGSDEVGHPTSYVSTRWYRAPEILLRSTQYSSQVDIWALGCIASELYTFEPLFPGRDEFDQLNLIFSAFGSPQMVDWKDGIKLLDTLNIQSWKGDRPINQHLNSHTFMSNALSNSTHFDLTVVVDFLLTLLSLNPANRSDANSALRHQYFAGATQQMGTTSEYNDSFEKQNRKVTPPTFINNENGDILPPFFGSNNNYATRSTTMAHHPVYYKNDFDAPRSVLSDVSNVKKRPLDINPVQPPVFVPYKNNPYTKGRVFFKNGSTDT